MPECRLRSRAPAEVNKPYVADVHVRVPWVVNCEDDILENGYTWGGQDGKYVCIPGYETWDASRFNNPTVFLGGLSHYADGQMERVLRFRKMGLGSKYKGAVALMGCGDIGRSAYIRIPGHNSDGPYLIADCSGRRGIYYNIVYGGLAVEVDYASWVRLGGVNYASVEVTVQRVTPPYGVPGESLSSWYLREGLSFEWYPWMQATPTTGDRER